MNHRINVRKFSRKQIFDIRAIEEFLPNFSRKLYFYQQIAKKADLQEQEQ